MPKVQGHRPRPKAEDRGPTATGRRPWTEGNRNIVRVLPSVVLDLVRCLDQGEGTKAHGSKAQGPKANGQRHEGQRPEGRRPRGQKLKSSKAKGYRPKVQTREDKVRSLSTYVFFVLLLIQQGLQDVGASRERLSKRHGHAPSSDSCMYTCFYTCFPSFHEPIHVEEAQC